MKFSDVRPGMTVAFSRHDARRWAEFFEPMMRNPNYTNPEDWYQKRAAMFENKPILVKKISVVKLGESFVPDDARPRDTLLVGEGPKGEYVSISEKWFNPNDEDTFKQVVGSDIRTDIKMNPARKQKGIVLGELKSLPGAVDYESAESRFKAGRKARKTRKGRKSRRHTRKH